MASSQRRSARSLSSAPRAAPVCSRWQAGKLRDEVPTGEGQELAGAWNRGFDEAIDCAIELPLEADADLVDVGERVHAAPSTRLGFSLEAEADRFQQVGGGDGGSS